MNLDYENFVSSLQEALKEKMPDAVLKREKINKVNETKDGLQVQFQKSGEADKITPTVYLDDLYMQFQKGDPLGLIASEISQTLKESTKKVMGSIQFDKGNLKESLFPCVINKEWNKELLKKIPHKDIEGTDLTIIARYKLGGTGGQEASAILNDKNLFLCGMQPEEALEQAMANGRNGNFVCKGLTDVLAGEMKKAGLSEEEISQLCQRTRGENFVFILSNKQNQYGAAALAYPDALKSAVKYIGEEKCYILPSSIHEVLLMPESMADKGRPEELAEMVKAVNETKVARCDQLSDNVYFFDGNILSLAGGKGKGHEPNDMPTPGIGLPKSPANLGKARTKAAAEEKSETRGR